MANSIRLKKNRDFSRVCRRGKRSVSQHLVLFANKNKLDVSRIGVAAGKKHPNAVARNRAKRRLRSVFRECSTRLCKGYDLVIIMRALDEPTYEQLRTELLKLLEKQQLLEE